MKIIKCEIAFHILLYLEWNAKNCYEKLISNYTWRALQYESIFVIIWFSVMVTGQKIAARPSKIVAGQEADRTNEFLQALADAINKKVIDLTHILDRVTNFFLYRLIIRTYILG